MTDVVVTLPKSFEYCGRKGLDGWRLEGGNPGEEIPHGVYYCWHVGRRAPKIERGERVYVVHDGKLIGYAPLVAIHEEDGRFYLVRRGGAVAVTIDEEIPGFRGYRYRWWDAAYERAIT